MPTSRFLPPAALWRARGLTLVELLAGVAILGILLGVGAPSFSRMLADYRLKGEKSGLLDSLVVAREEARQSGSSTAVCASNNGTTCTATDWRQGHIVFRDANGNGSVNTGEAIVARVAGAAPGITITTVELASDLAIDVVRFDHEGKLAVTTQVQFTVCKPGVPRLLVAVRRNGQVKASSGGDCA